MPSVVVSSIENPEGSRCVDIFVRPDGTYGFEEWRSDPEDCGIWHPLGLYSHGVYGTKEDAIAAARAAVAWLAPAMHP